MHVLAKLKLLAKYQKGEACNVFSRYLQAGLQRKCCFWSFFFSFSFFLESLKD